MNNETITIQQGKIIYRAGNPARSLYIIKKGIVRLLKFHESRMIVVANLHSKDVFGSEDIFNKSVYSNYAVALVETELLEIKTKEVRSQINAMPGWIDHVLSTLSSRLDQTENILVEHKIYKSELDDEVLIDEALNQKIRENIKLNSKRL